MTVFIIYLFGVISVLIGCYYYSMKDEDIILGDIIRTVLLSLLSWITVIIVMMLIINDLLEHLLDFNKVIYRRKERRNRL